MPDKSQPDADQKKRQHAITRFTERIQKTGGFVDEAELEALRESGIPEAEAKEIAKTRAAAVNSTSLHSQRLEKIRRFTDRVRKTGLVDEAEVETLRTAGISEREIQRLVYSTLQ